MSTVLTTNAQMVRWNQAQLRAALKLYLKTGMLPSRNVTMGDLLKRAGYHTGKVYVRSRRSCQIAIDDLNKLLEA